VLASLSFTPTSIDTTAGAAQVQVTARVTDALAGVSSISVQFRSLSGNQERRFGIPRTAGTAFDGTYTATLTFPQFSEAGAWRLDQVEARDLVGNFGQLFTTGLQALGFNTALQVTSTQGIETPVLASLSFTPTSINTTAGAAPVQVTMQVTDALAGVSSILVSFRSLSGNQERLFGIPRTAGTAFDGTYTATLTFPRFSEAGAWRLHSVRATDLVGNSRSFFTTGLQALGFNTALQVTSTQGTETPVLASLNFTPTSIDTTAGAAQVQVTLRVTDALAGVSSISVQFQSPSGNQRRGNNSLTRTAGTAFDGTYTGTITFPQFSEAGAWRLQSVRARDLAGNQRTLFTTGLQALGFNTALQVN
jgi:hypothetical protein